MTELEQRAESLQNALASFSLEFLTPNAAQLADFESWLAGECGDQQLMESAYEIWQRQRSLR